MNPKLASSQRGTAEERRAELLEAAQAEFAARGYEGASTERIAKAVGLSQPYVFRLFGTKKQLYLESIDHCMTQTLEMFREASHGLSGDEALQAIGAAYMQRIMEQPEMLRAQLQSYAACGGHEDVSERVRAGYQRLVEHVERVSGLPVERVSAFFAQGMLLNTIMAMGLVEHPTDWGARLLEGCGKELGQVPE
jgi:AcrR family transcriptional regulator